MTMPRHPQDEIRICMERRNQLLLGYTGAGAPTHGRTRRFDAYRYVRGDDHELGFSLALLKFTYEPVITFLVKRRVPIAVIIGIVVPLGIVEHDDPERYIRLRFEGVAGESRLYVRFSESMSFRTCLLYTSPSPRD